MRRQTGNKRRLPEGDGWSRTDAIIGVALLILPVLMIGCGDVIELDSQMGWNQVTAVLSLREINTAETTYAKTYGKGYSPSLKALGPPPGNGQPSASASFLIDDLLASGKKSGYSFKYSAGPKDAEGHIKTYTVVARPLKWGIRRHYVFQRGSGATGTDSLFTDESGVIRRTSEDRPATAKDPPVGG